MHRTSFNRMYIILRAVNGHAAGFARLESQRGRGRISVHANNLPEGPVRVMLLSGDEKTGAILDLGLMHPTAAQQAALSRDDVALHGSYHTLLLASDWPHAQLLLYGWLNNTSSCTLWQMQEAVRHYLAVPAGDSPPAPVDIPQEQIRPSVLALQPIAWPEEVAELQPYFGTQPLSAPLNRPGWRFVRVPLQGQPAGYCDVGIRVLDHRVTEVLYALPQNPGLQGYQQENGRYGPCWVLHQPSGG